MSDKPTCLPVNFDGIPMDLKMIPRWVLWSLVQVGDEDNRRWSKMPLQPTGQAAKSTDPATWSDFLTVQNAYTQQKGKFDGVGFVFSDDDNIIGVDGILTTRTDGMNKRVSNIDKQIDNMESRLEMVQARYERQYSALDVTVSNANSLAAYLTQQLASLNSSSNS